MRNLQFTEDNGIFQVRKHTRIVTILFICFCFTSLVIFKITNSKQIRLHPSSKPNSLEKVAEKIVFSLNPGEQKNSSKEGSNNTRHNIIVNDEKDLFEELASLFNKDICLSRSQRSSYRKTRPYNPSPYLISKLRAYQELHKRCGPMTRSYKRAMRKLSSLSSSGTGDVMQCRYLVWTPANGLGNRMVSIASAFLYALLESRVLLVDFGRDMDDLFCEPFPGSTWLLPKNFPHKHLWTNPSPNPNPNPKNPNLNLTYLKDNVYHLNLQHGREGDLALGHFHCNDTQLFLQEKPVIILRSDQYFVPSLFLMPSLKSELNRMFQVQDSVFGILGHYLFNPSNNVWGLITRFYQAYLANSDTKIGVQIRVFSKVLHYDQIMTQILSCLLQNHILPSLDTNSTTLSTQNMTLSTVKSKSVLVSSLYPQFSEQLKSLYWTNPTMTREVIRVYQPSHEEHQKFGDNVHNMKAWAEMYLLSLCDVLVTSDQSTFGYVAQGLAGLKPWILDRLDGPNASHLSCKRGVSSEPCFHVPPTNDCHGNKISNFTSLNQNLRQCEDVWWGIKLVNP